MKKKCGKENEKSLSIGFQYDLHDTDYKTYIRQGDNMVTVNNSDYYNNIPAGRDLNKLPNNSSAGTTVGYQYDGLTEEDRFVQKVLQEHYDKVYKENLSHSE